MQAQIGVSYDVSLHRNAGRVHEVNGNIDPRRMIVRPYLYGEQNPAYKPSDYLFLNLDH